MPTDPLFARFADRLARSIKEQPEHFDKEVAAFVEALQGRTMTGQAKAHGISPADLSGLTQVGVQVGQALLTRDDQELSYVERMASSTVPPVRCCAAMALGEFGNTYPRKIVPLAYTLAQDDAWEVREFIANAFDERMSAKQGDFVYDLMTQWCEDKNENVRRVPTNALMRYGRRYPEKVLKLMETLRADTSAYVRKNVCFCLGVIGLERHPQIGYPDATNPGRILKLLQHWIMEDNEGTHWIIAETLGRAWSKSVPDEALSILQTLADDPSKTVRSAVTNSLKAICKRDASTRDTLKAWLNGDSLRIREVVQKVL